MAKKAKGASKAATKQAKKEKQLQKSQKKVDKKKKGESTTQDDEDLEAILAELREQDAKRTAISVESNAAQPTPRSNASLCQIQGTNNPEIILFGGEYYDGHSSDCFNDLYRFHLEKLEWKRISSPNCPGHRNAHQAVAFRDAMYVFGGEFSSGFQFKHYRDLWRLDLASNEWKQLELATGPSPRSGHRMVLWKHFLVLFGGFYETSRGVNFFDDLYFFDLREEKWHLGTSSKGSKPSPRSGFQFQAHSSANTIFLYGGYSKVCVSAENERGRNLDDMWALNLSQPLQSGHCPGYFWERVPNKGAAPPKSSGASSCVHKNRMILFGGVSDTETSNDVVGAFSNSIHAFDMDRRRWFQLAVGKKKKSSKPNKVMEKNSTEIDMVADRLADASVRSSLEEEDINEEEEAYEYAGMELDENSFYVIVDGKLTKVDYEDDES